jgi:cytochrome c-type biogenesis protein
MDFQAWVSGEVGQLAGMLHVGYAFGAGMVSAVNPCGFAMLPVYLSLYLGAQNDSFQQQSWLYRLGKALGITAIVTSGYGLLFGLIGLLVSVSGAYLMAAMPWVSIIIGLFLILLGFWLLFGNHLSFTLFTQIGMRIGDPRSISIRGFFLFGIAFGATSLSCTLPIFLVVVGGALSSGDTAAGLMQFFWYTLGTGFVFLFLTVGMAFVKRTTVTGALSRFVPYVHKLSAFMLISAGGYICYYWFSSGLLVD